MTTDPRNPADDEPDVDASTDDLVARLDQLWSKRPASPAVGSLEGQRIGSYEIQRPLGHGTFGVVYLARDLQLGRDVALKLPRPEVLIDDEKRQRFENEATAAAGLDHPAIVPIHEANLDGPTPYIASAYCPGTDLARWLAERTAPVPYEQAVRLVIQLARAVQHAHDQGVIHRDLKPGNVLLIEKDAGCDSGSELDQFAPRLTDFGLAKLADGTLVDTRSSLLLGTPLYMAPEQLEFRRLHEQTGSVDVYGLGVLLFELLTGRTPIRGSTYVEVADAIRESPPPKLRTLRSDAPRDLEIICAMCLEKDPATRYATAAALADDLERFLDFKSIHARRANIAERLRYWARRPQRRREVALALILINIALTLFGFLGVAGWVLIDGVNMGREDIMASLKFLVLVSLPFEVYLIAASVLLSKEGLDRGWCWLALLISLFWTVGSVAAVAGWIIVTPWYEQNPGGRIPVFTLAALLWGTQVLLWFVAIQATSRRQQFLGAATSKLAKLFRLNSRKQCEETSASVEETHEWSSKADASVANGRVTRLVRQHWGRILALVTIVALSSVAWVAIRSLPPEPASDLREPGKELSADSTLESSTTGAKPAQPSEISPDRRAARWLMEIGGRGRLVLNDGAPLELDQIDRLPDEPFRLQALTIPAPTVDTLNEMHHVQGLVHLEAAFINYCPLTSEHLMHLRDSLNLRTLHIESTNVRQMDAIVQFEKLAGLKLPNDMTDRDLEAISHLRDLRQLDLGGCRISAVGLAALEMLANLQTLNLRPLRRVTPEFIRALAALRGLRSLEINKAMIEPDVFSQFANLTQIEKLSLLDCDITDEAIPFLAELKQLTLLNVNNTQISASGAEQLRAALPQCEILHIE